MENFKAIKIFWNFCLERTWRRLSTDQKKLIKKQWDSIEAGFVVGSVIFWPLAAIEFKFGIGRPLNDGFLAIFAPQTLAYLIVAGMYACAVGAFWGPAWRATKTIHDSIFWGIPFIFAILVMSFLGMTIQWEVTKEQLRAFAATTVLIVFTIGVLMILTQIGLKKIGHLVAADGNAKILPKLWTWKNLINELKKNRKLIRDKAGVSAFLLVAGSILACVAATTRWS